MRPITDRQRAVLEYLREHGNSTPAEIAYGIGMDELPPVIGSGSGAGRGSGHRVFNPAQRIISSLTGLAGRGLIVHLARLDGRSGASYAITDAGHIELLVSDHRRRARQAARASGR